MQLALQVTAEYWRRQGIEVLLLMSAQKFNNCTSVEHIAFSPAFANIMLGVVFIMNNQRMQKFIVKYSINYPSGKKWVTQRECYGITELGAKDVIYWIHKNKDVSIISVEPTYQYSALAVYGDNHTVGER